MRAPLLALPFLAACKPDTPWEPPGDGEPKGCREQASFDRPIAATLGLSSHLAQGSDDEDAADRAFELAAWEAMGMGIVRRDIHWKDVEPEQGSFDFTKPDVFIDATESVGAEPLGLLVYGNPWASSEGDDHGYPPDDPADYAAYAVETARHYGERIRRYEIWNEPNAGIRFWKPEEDPVAYADLLATAAEALHAEDPDLEVGMGGIFLPDLMINTPGLAFMEAAFEARPDLLDLVDAVGVHPYRYPFTAPEHRDDWQGSWLDDLCACLELLDAHGGGDLPLWVTEVGWHTAGDALYEGVSEDEQAAYLLRSFISGLTHQQAMYLWYTFDDGGDNDADQEQMFGLWTHDDDHLGEPEAQPKRGVEAWKRLVDVLGEHDEVVDQGAWLGLDDQTWAYELSDGSDTAWILWSSGDEATVRVPGLGQATLLEMTDGSTTLEAVDGAFEVPIDGEPCYLLPQETP